MINDGNRAWIDSFLSAITPPKRLHVSEWADKYRMLPKASAEPGRWRTNRTPYLKEIMDELSKQSSSKKVVLMKGAQTGGTEAGLNWVGYTIDHDPSTMMIVWPALPDVLTNNKLRVSPLINETPRLTEAVHDHKGRKEGSSARFKSFDGGALVLTGANSASGLRSIPAKKLLLDEIDGYPDDVEGEGDPIALVLARQRTFPNRKTFIISTPTYKGKSKIEKEFRASDQRYFYVPCLNCFKKQILDWNQISFDVAEDENGDPVVNKLLIIASIVERRSLSIIRPGCLRKESGLLTIQSQMCQAFTYQASILLWDGTPGKMLLKNMWMLRIIQKSLRPGLTLCSERPLSKRVIALIIWPYMREESSMILAQSQGMQFF